MKGDFSRGFDPDRKRGLAYRRILLQQGRVLLDSDFNAAIDSQDQLIREIARDFGCRAGSPDLGFLITPGRLLALFDPIAAIEPLLTGDVEAVHDYNRKYLDRYPALRVTGTGGGAGGTIRIPFLVPLSGTVTIALWVLADVATVVAVTGAGNLNVPAQLTFARETVTLTDADSIELVLNAGDEFWIALIETDVDAGLAPSFGVAEGRYFVEGLSVEATDGPIALFDLYSAIAPIPNGITVARDDAVMLFDRFPAFRVTAGAAAGTVRFPFRFGVTGAAELDLWLQAAAATTIAVTGVGNINVPGPGFSRHPIALNDPDDLEIALDPGEEIWVGLIELRSGAGFAPGLWPAIGYGPELGFEVQDLEIPDPNAPGGTRDLQPGDRLVVYLEGYERHVTAVDDLGLREQALGNGPDTCTRSADIGQAKLAPANDLDADTALAAAEAMRAFRRRQFPTGALVIDTPPQLDDPDPCALPAAGGYTGRDHRLYRFEVHAGGAVPDTLIKWSRDNGSELFPLFSLTAAEIETLADTPLRDGDLVELLSEAIELGDAGLATIDAANERFSAPTRSVGDLVRLRDEGLIANGTRRRFSLRDPNDEAIPPVVPVVPDRYGLPAAMRLKARRWHGMIAPAGAPSPFTIALEDGLTVTLTGGGFEPGDWWQYEARVGRDNANGPWRARPHGPERLFAPLSLMQFQGPNEPLLLLAWLDERFPSLCSIDADDIAFDGGVCGTDASTVQEFLEELCDREPAGGCCDVTLLPEPAGNDAERIRGALAELPAGSTAVVCLHRGVYRFETVLEVNNRSLVVRGCPDAVIVGLEGGAPLFRVINDGRLALESLTLFGAETAPLPTLVEVAANAASLDLRDAGLINIANPEGGASAIRILGPEPDIAALDNPLAPAPASNFTLGAPQIVLDRTTVVAQRGIRGGGAARLSLRDSVFVVVGPAVAMADIGMLDLAHTALRTGLDLAAAAAWTAEDLLARGEFLVAALIDGLPPGGGNQPAFVANAIWSGSARRVLATGTHGFLLGITLALTFDHGALFVSTAGIAVKSAAATTIDGQRITVNGAEAGVGVHLLHQGISVKIGKCEIASDDSGIIIGAPRSPNDLPGPAVLFLGLHVDSNTIEAEIGITVGSRSDVTLNGIALAVDLRANHVAASDTGIVLRGLSENAAAFNAVDIRASDNMIVAAVGFDIIGGNFTLADNQASPPPFGVQSVALRAARSPRLVIEGSRLIALTNDAKLAAGGVSLVACNDAILRGNTFANSGQSPALLIQDSTNPRFANNIVSAELSLIGRCNNPIIQSNDFAAAVSIDGCTSGTVTDNRTGRFQIDDLVAFSLIITNAAGEWQVEDNRADGLLAIGPRVVGINTGGFIGGLNSFVAADRWDGRVLAAIDRLAAEDGAEPSVEARAGGFASRTEAASFLVSSGNLNEVMTEAMVNSINAAFNDLVAEAIRPGSFVAAVLREQPIHVQANGNWAENMTIGFDTAGVGNATTTVQAIGNRIAGQLFVRAYRRRNVSQNVATTYPAWIASQAGPIGADNLDL